MAFDSLIRTNMDDTTSKSAPLESLPTLSEIDAIDDSALAHALRRMHRSELEEREGISAHRSTTHTSSHSSTPW